MKGKARDNLSSRCLPEKPPCQNRVSLKTLWSCADQRCSTSVWITAQGRYPDDTLFPLTVNAFTL